MYKEILERVEREQEPVEGVSLSEVREDILKDIPRTYFVSHDEKLKGELLRILMSVAFVMPTMGYC